MQLYSSVIPSQITPSRSSLYTPHGPGPGRARYAQFIGYGHHNHVSPHSLEETRYPSLWILMQGVILSIGNVIGGGHGPHGFLVQVRVGNIDASHIYYVGHQHDGFQSRLIHNRTSFIPDTPDKHYFDYVCFRFQKVLPFLFFAVPLSQSILSRTP